jgi:hypothetical protein
MNKYLTAGSLALLATVFGVAAQEGVPPLHPLSISPVPTPAPTPVSLQTPGPSEWLFDHPYYKCTRNFYVATNGSNGNNGTTAATPWLTLQRANYSALMTGDCVNVAPGIYRNGVNLTKGGSYAAPDGYITYRCTKLDACIITDARAAFTIQGADAPAKYIIIDGFELAASSSIAYGQGIKIWDGSGDKRFTTHHIWLINNIVHNYGQSGIQINDGEFYYVLHNRTYDNSRHTCDARGSGISMGFLKQIPSGYSPTADDLVNSQPMVGTLTPFRNLVAWNIAYNNNVDGCNQSDGNGVIMDHFDIGGMMYPHRSLVAFNIIYNNGGSGLDVFVTDHITAANNSTFNNSLLAGYNATGRAEMQWHSFNSGQTDNNFFNNIAMAIPGSGNLAANVTYIFEDRFGSHAGSDGGITSNVSIGPLSYGSSQFSCSTNKCNASKTDYYVNVGNTFNGTMDAEPDGANFALSAGSPAIGYGLSRPYLSSQSVDAGACYHTLIQCGVINK